MAYKVMTHEYRPPIQGGEPIWDGMTLPWELPAVVLDTSDEACAPGWYAADAPEEALAVAGLWPDGWPACVVECERMGAVHVPPGGKPRSEGLRLVRRCEPGEVREAIGRWTAGWAGELAAKMTAEQWGWYEALGRLERDEGAVEAGLGEALATRGLGWTLQRFRDAWDARAARTARDAWAALNVFYVAHKGWIAHPPDLLTRGLRDAYRHGLALALPTGPDTLGWAMED